MGEERRFQEPQLSVAPMAVNSSPTSSYIDNRRSPRSSVTVQMEEKYQPPSATSLYESRFQRRQVAIRYLELLVNFMCLKDFKGALSQVFRISLNSQNIYLSCRKPTSNGLFLLTIAILVC